MKNFTIMQFPAGSISAFDLADAVRSRPLKDVAPLELASFGFGSPLAPFDSNTAPAPVLVGDNVAFLSLVSWQKILPSSAINAELAKRIRVIEERDGKSLGGRARKRLKEDVVHELLPTALVKPVRVDFFVDLGRGLLVVDTATRKSAETVASELRQALGSFPALPLSAGIAPRSVLTGWISGDSLPDSFALGEECELRDADDHGAVVRCQRQDLVGEEISSHLESGKQVTRLALSNADSSSFTLDEDLVVRKFRLLDGAIDKIEGCEDDSADAVFEATCFILLGEFREIFEAVRTFFRVEHLS